MAESKSFLSRVYNASPFQMIKGLVKSCSLSEDELSELKELIIEPEKDYENNWRCVIVYNTGWQH